MDPQRQPVENQAMFVWSDMNGDGLMQPDEVQFIKASAAG